MKKRILIVDDDQSNRRILREIFEGEYELSEADLGEDCLSQMKIFGPDLVLLDIMMPDIDGYDVCRQIKSAPYGELTLVILVSGKASTVDRLKGYEMGADDFIVKPFDHDELSTRVRILFRLRGALKELSRANSEIHLYNTKLERVVRERTAEIVETRDMTVFALAKLAESRDPETGEHLERIRSYSQILAEELAETGPYTEDIDKTFLANLHMSSPLHDIGKVGIPDAILLKPGRLSAMEFRIMQSHSLIGADALREAAEHTQSGGFLNMAVEIAEAHHERFDGSGYPHALSETDIPLAARIVALADVYDALTSVRVYKSAFKPEVARSMIENESGQHFDPAIADAFTKRFADFLQVREQCGTAEGDPVLT
ncbi:MAG: response regulator [Planctomycetota bacterium]|nr:response regulator [Planctomycetota bacterium]